MRALRLVAAGAVAVALALPAGASATGGCTVYWREVATVGPATVKYPYCIW